MQRPRFSVPVAILSAAVVAVLGTPAAGFAEIRQGTATDPTGDSAGAPPQDIVSATGQYDTNGQVTVSATMNGDIPSGPDSFFSFRVASFAAPNLCTGANVSLFGFSSAADGHGVVTATGISGTGTAFKSVSGNRLAFSGSGTGLQNKDWSCMTLAVTPKGSGGTFLDQLDVPLFFNGFGPDTDTDGILDNVDQCPSAAGPAPTGCPASAPAPASPTAGPAGPAGPVASSVRVTSRQRGSTVRGSLWIDRVGSRLDVQALARRAHVTNSTRRGSIRVGRFTRNSVGGRRVPFAARLNTGSRRALSRRGRLRITVRIRVTPRSGTAFTATRAVTLRRTR